MNGLFLTTMLAVAAIVPANAQFGSGIVYDPTQSVHAAQQILQADQLYTTALKTTQKVIVAYNLAQRMATASSSLIRANTNMGQQFWIPSLNQPAHTAICSSSSMQLSPAAARLRPTKPRASSAPDRSRDLARSVRRAGGGRGSGRDHRPV